MPIWPVMSNLCDEAFFNTLSWATREGRIFLRVGDEGKPAPLEFVGRIRQDKGLYLSTLGRRFPGDPLESSAAMALLSPPPLPTSPSNYYCGTLHSIAYSI
ncbi:hypothetical protein M422DRAFT_272621 [Sphaerobolus stellatus SS14]|uniref:Uncharacterized protein n=1 Tax=Sphaerobolus stellatus (strain SS14) TaxID=990650 RepID=A0A0C9TB48_SPHS4|nr:hypothetical protein M422DRAFT_272621 [Sphaerobolus stellatus SS14]